MQDFNFHQHTYRCGHADNKYSDEEYVIESINNNLKAICFTEHGPNHVDKRKNMRINQIDRYEYLDSIEKLKERHKGEIEIYKGYELEYTDDFIEYLEIFKSESDIVILGQHFIKSNNKAKVANYEKYTDEDLEEYTRTIEKALDTGCFDILGHPDFIMLAREKFGKKEEEMTNRICSSCEKNDVPLEINLNKIFAKTYFDYDKKILKKYKKPEKYRRKVKSIKYPCKDFWKIVSDYDVKVLYGIDTHFKGQISLFNEMTNLANYMLGDETINKLNFCTKEEIIEKAKVRRR